MNKADLILAISEKEDLSKQDVENVINEFLRMIEKEVIKGKDVKLSNFGVFYKKERKARKGTNPSDGKAIIIPANNTVGFRPSKSIKGKLN